jgi:hypothetical protein
MESSDRPPEPPQGAPTARWGNRLLAIAAAATAAALALHTVAVSCTVEIREEASSLEGLSTYEKLLLASLAVLIVSKLFLLFAILRVLWSAFTMSSFSETKWIVAFNVFSYLTTAFMIVGVGFAVQRPHVPERMQAINAVHWGVRVDLMFLAFFWIGVAGDLGSDRLLGIFRLCGFGPALCFMLSVFTMGHIWEYTAMFGLGWGHLWLIWAVAYIVGLVGICRLVWLRPHELELSAG